MSINLNPSVPIMGPTQCIRIYTPSKNHIIHVLFDLEKGLCAQIQRQGKTFEAKKVPLIGVPKEIFSLNDIPALIRYFAHTHFMPLKGINDEFNGIAVNLSLKGGGKSKIPFQPGLALGSIVRGESLDQMEEYAEKVANIEMYEKQIREAQQRMDDIDLKISERLLNKYSIEIGLKAENGKITKEQLQKGEFPGESSEDGLIKVWFKEKQAVNDMIGKLQDEIAKEGNAFNIPIFKGFQQAMVSPIDMGASKWEVQKRGFDSLDYSSQYFKKGTNSADVHNKAQNASSSNSFNASASGSFWGVKASAQASHAWSNAVASRVSQMEKEDSTKGVLLVNATVTTRNVRCFTELVWNKLYLGQIIRAMGGSTDALDTNELENFASELETNVPTQIASLTDENKKTALMTAVGPVAQQLRNAQKEIKAALVPTSSQAIKDQAKKTLVMATEVAKRFLASVVTAFTDAGEQEPSYFLDAEKYIDAMTKNVTDKIDGKFSPGTIADDKELSKLGISKLKDGSCCIYLLTEAVLGGSFTAVITFSDGSKFGRNADAKTETKSSTTSYSGSVGWGPYSASVGGSHASESGSQSEDDVIRGSNSTEINIELYAQGTIPIFTRNTLEREILNNLDLDPSKFQVAKKDEVDVKNLLSKDADARMLAVEKRRMQLDNAAVAVLNTYRGLTATKVQQKVHTLESAMEAYENFAEQMTKDEGCGIPIGFNYVLLRRQDLEEEYARLVASQAGSPST